MSKVTYAIRNGNYNIGLLWENEKLGKVLTIYPDAKVDMNCDLEIINAETGHMVNHIDLRDFLLETLPVEFINTKE